MASPLGWRDLQFPGQMLSSLPSIVPTGTGAPVCQQLPTASACQPFPTPNPENVHTSKEGGESVGKEGGESVWVEGRTLVCAAESGLEIRG